MVLQREGLLEHNQDNRRRDIARGRGRDVHMMVEAITSTKAETSSPHFTRDVARQEEVKWRKRQTPAGGLPEQAGPPNLRRERRPRPGEAERLRDDSQPPASRNPSRTRRGAVSPAEPSSRLIPSASTQSSSTLGAQRSSATTAWDGSRRPWQRGGTSVQLAESGLRETRTPLCPPSGNGQARAGKREANDFSRGRMSRRCWRSYDQRS